MTKATDAAARRRALEPVLLARRRQVVRQVVRLEDDLDWLQTNVGPELLEEGQEQSLAGVLERLDEHDRDELAAIELALTRLRRGDYSLCEACGGSIPLARQEAMPTATLCLACAAAREAAQRL